MIKKIRIEIGIETEMVTEIGIGIELVIEINFSGKPCDGEIFIETNLDIRIYMRKEVENLTKLLCLKLRKLIVEVSSGLINLDVTRFKT